MEWKEIITLNKLNSIHETLKTPMQLALEKAIREKLKKGK